MSNRVTSTTLPLALWSSVIGTYAIGTLLNADGARIVTHFFSLHLSLTLDVFWRTNYNRPLKPKYKLYDILDCAGTNILLQHRWNSNMAILCLKVFHYCNHRSSRSYKSAVQSMQILCLLVSSFSKSYLESPSLKVKAVRTRNYLPIAVLSCHPRIKIICFGRNFSQIPTGK